MLTEELFKKGRLCIVGNINRDVKTAPFKAGAGLLCDGETPVPAISETIGGGGANSAFAAAALGAQVAFIGKVGADPLGSLLQAMLTRHGIEARLARDPLNPTGTSLALIYADGQRHFLSCQPNNTSLRFEDLNLADLSKFTHLSRTDIWFSEAMLFGGNKQLFQAARQAGLAVSIDLNWDPQWGVVSKEQVARRKQAIRELLPLVQLAHGNVRELNEFADSPDLEVSLARLTEWGVGAVVVHLGQNGAGYWERGQWTTAPAAPVARFINATGCGDVLSVCMMLLHGHPDPAAQLLLANQVVAEFIEGRSVLIPPLA